MGISTCSPSRNTTAIGGASSSRVRIASFAPPRARISNQWPEQHKGGQHRGGLVEDLAAAGQVTPTLYSQPAPTATATSTIMSSVRARSARYAPSKKIHAE